VISGKEGLPEGAPLFKILGNADGLGLMMKGSLVALASAALLAIVMRALSLTDTLAAAMNGMKELFEALAVLYLAWALGAAMKELHAAEFLVGSLRTSLAPALLPTLVFLVSAVTSFATGTSFGTMAILMPMVIPLAFSLAPHSEVIPLASSGSVLAGATFGDHCSPISDTTVLSAIGSGCDLVDHVRTQLPYALMAAVITVLFGTLPSGFGVPPWVTIPVASVATVASLYLFGKRVAA